MNDETKDLTGFRTITKFGRKLDVYADGRVWRCGFKSKRGAWYCGRWLSPVTNSHGYSRIGMKVNMKRVYASVHRLLAEAFLDGYSEDLQVDHMDGNKLNNSLSNLQMVTQSGNNRSYATKRKGSSSRMRGVSWDKRCKNWLVHVSGKDGVIHVGRFECEIDAALAHDERAELEGYSFGALNRTNHEDVAEAYALKVSRPNER